jgi:hypothetical protein
MIALKIIIFIVICVLAANLRIIHSKYQAVFYYKGRKKDSNITIEKWKNNIHILANQSYRLLFGLVFLFCLLFLIEYYGWLSLLYSSILTILISASTSYSWQKWINLSVGLPEIDPNEKHKFEYIIFGKSFWVPKFWYGKRRKLISLISIKLFILLSLFLFSNIKVT